MMSFNLKPGKLYRYIGRGWIIPKKFLDGPPTVVLSFNKIFMIVKPLEDYGNAQRYLILIEESVEIVVFTQYMLSYVQELK
jgi:hypothetical protein